MGSFRGGQSRPAENNDGTLVIARTCLEPGNCRRIPANLESASSCVGGALLFLAGEGRDLMARKITAAVEE